jgi:urease accessory protein
MNAATLIPSGWRAGLRLQFSARAARTWLSRREHYGPLRVQRPFYPEAPDSSNTEYASACHTYLVHPPGGIVGGDELDIQVDVTERSRALLTTPAATKFYRSDGRLALQRQHMTIAAATLEWLPQETIFYPGARARSSTRIDLGPGAKFIGWEIPCLGLPARGEIFDTGQLALDLELWRKGRPLFVDRLRIDGDSVAKGAKCDLAGHHAIGTLLAYPADPALLTLVREILGENPAAAATLVDGVLMCRALGAQAEPVKRVFVAVWQAIRPRLLGCEAVLPRIWAS